MESDATSEYEYLDPCLLFAHADRLYGMALQVTQQAINDPQHTLTDETLLAILLFAVSTGS